MANLGRNASRDHRFTSDVQRRHCERSEAIHLTASRKNGLLRGACHRARIRATRWLAMTWIGRSVLDPPHPRERRLPARHTLLPRRQPAPPARGSAPRATTLRCNDKLWIRCARPSCKSLGQRHEQSGVTMSLFKMRMTGQQSDYFFVYAF